MFLGKMKQVMFWNFLIIYHIKIYFQFNFCSKYYIIPSLQFWIYVYHLLLDLKHPINLMKYPHFGRFGDINENMTKFNI